MNFGRFLKLCTNETKNIFTIHFFYHLFIDILRLHKKLTEKEKLKIHKVMSWQSEWSKKREYPGVHDFNHFWSFETKKPNGFLISINAAIAWTLEKTKKIFSQNGGRSKKIFFETKFKGERSQRLRTKRSAMVPTVWSRFIENSQNYHKPGAYITFV